ncbi:hypothetical protein C8J56DRAFT_1028249 [Mycena floridula]|nr:hypothetical protein C8J56DRAFT_1028249 [Mycena floridula]
MSTSNIISTTAHAYVGADFALASAVVILYEYCITFDLEWQYIWKAKFNLMKALYLIQRYMPLIDSVALEIHILFNPGPIGPSPKFCQVVFPLRAAMYIVGIAVSEVILTLRVWAVWHRDKRLTIGLPIFYGVTWISSFVSLAVFLSTLTYAPPVRFDVGCVVSDGNSVVFLCWIVLLAYDAGILCLMAIKAYQAYKSSGDSGLYNVIYRDGIIYYVYLFILSATNIVVILTFSRDLASLLAGLERVIHASLTSRVVLHIREQAGRDVIYSKGPANSRSAGPELTWVVNSGAHSQDTELSEIRDT